MTTYVFLLTQYLGLTTLSGSTDRERILTGGFESFDMFSQTEKVETIAFFIPVADLSSLTEGKLLLTVITQYA